MTDAFIYDAIRTPRGKGRKDGALHEVTSLRLSAGILDALAERNGIEGHVLEDVIWGNATQVGEQGGCLARSAVLASSLDERAPRLREPGGAPPREEGLPPSGCPYADTIGFWPEALELLERGL